MKRLLLSSILLIGAIVIPMVTSAAEEATPTLRLEEVLQEVIQRNPQVRAAERGARAAEARIPQARALEDPQFGVMQWSIPSNFNLFDADETWYTLSQNFPFFGKRALRGDIAKLETSMASEESRAVRLKIVKEAKQAYYDFFFTHKALDIHHKQVVLARRFSIIAQEKFAVGEVGQQDVIRAQVELLDLSNALVTSEQDRNVAAARLNALLDRLPDASLGVPETPTIPAVEPELEMLQREAEAARPEIQMQALAIRRGEESVALAERDLFPDVVAEVGYWDVHDGSNRWMASIKINLPWMNKKKYDARIRENEAEQSRAEADRQAALNETQFRIKDLFVRFQTAKRLATLYQQGILPLAEQSLEAAAVGYEAKKNDFLTLIDAQENIKRLELTYFRTLAEIWKRLAELEEMTGKMF
ncbi:MAG: TolC family protein [Candidatus Manganitrophus sp. SB1]|nr:TolC family protein [Candidatus Manganitrophus morganii]